MGEPVRVLLMARALGLGGSERQLALLAKHLDRRRFAPRVGCFQSEGVRGEELLAAGVPVVTFPVRTFLGPAALAGARRMIRYLEEEQVAIVHTFDTPANLFGVPVARAARTPVAISSQRAHRELAGGVRRHLLRLTDQVVDAIVVNCEFVKRHLVEDEKVPEARVRVCHNGIELDRFSPHGRRKGEFGCASVVIGTVCALRPEKGLEVLLEAFARVRGYESGVKLVIVGDGPSLEGLKGRAKALELGESCEFFRARSEVADLLRRIDIFVLPSRSEALSNSLMEAMACGCCAVASRVGGNPELVADGKTGILVAPGAVDELAAALRFLMENDRPRRRLAEAGAEFVRTRFSHEASARRMAEVYSEFLEG
jgi:glycosyltransferase involved in cell wall biosynthesis